MDTKTGFRSETSQVVNIPAFIVTLLITVALIIFSGVITQNIDKLLTFIPESLNVPEINSMMIIFVVIAIVWLRLIWKVLVVKNLYYDFEDERLVMHFGVFNKKKDYIEYFRIKDYAIERPLIARLFGLHHLDIISSDRTHPHLKLKYLNNFKNREPEIREGIKRAAESGRGREVDVV